MKIYCWNVRGLNSPLKQHEVVSLIKKNKLDVCGLVETKLASSAVSFMHKLQLRNWRFLSNVAATDTARILVF
jgi:exonuclease III